MRIVFIGSVLFSKEILNHLFKKKLSILLIITKKIYKKKSDKIDLSHYAKKNNTPFLHVKNINDKKSIDKIKSLKPDLILCLGWSEILNTKILEIPKIGTIGYHPSDLPINRGRHPIIWSLVKGLKKTASTFIFIKKGIDNGDIISKKKIFINFNDNAEKLYKKLIKSAKKQIDEIIHNLNKNKLRSFKQDEKKSNYCRKRNYSDGKIDWRMSAVSIHNLVRALSKPYDGAHFIYNYKEYKVWKVKISNYENINLECGKVIKVKHNVPMVKCGKSSILLEKISPKLKFKEGMYL